MKVGSLFSGIGGFDLGFERAGHTIEFQVEVDEKCQKILDRHFDAKVKWGDITTLEGEGLPEVDCLVGGFPCQDLSMAGGRAGLAGGKSRLFWEYMRLVDEVRPKWLVIENVPGLLSSNKGRDMATITGALVERGYGWAYRVLDAQAFGVPQRRRRVFIVGRSGGDTRSAAEVLFEPESLCGDAPSRRTQGQEVAGTLGGGSGERGWSCDTDRMTFLPVVYDPTQVTSKLNRSNPQPGDPSHPLVANGYAPVLVRMREGKPGGGKGPLLSPDSSLTLATANDQVLFPGVRRLTPMECERLQGFPDGWTEGFADSVRYRTLGNAVCVNVVEWLANRFPLEN